MKNLFRHFLTFLSLLPHYWKSTRSFDMMWRYVVVSWFTALNLVFGSRMNWVAHWVYSFCNKTFLFRTPWGTYLAHTKNAWSVTQPGYEPEIREVIDANREKFGNEEEKIFIDIGAHVGRYVIELAKNYGYTSIAFEPSPETFKMLKVNTILSGVDEKVTLNNFWLSDTVGEIEFEYFESHDGGSRVPQYTDAYSHLATRITIPVRVFDDLPINIAQVRLVLIDVEGYELFVLRWMKKALEKFVSGTDVIVEIFENNPARDETVRFMENLGYSSKQIEKDNWSFVKN